jgi:hypothetical protein
LLQDKSQISSLLSIINTTATSSVTNKTINTGWFLAFRTSDAAIISIINSLISKGWLLDDYAIVDVLFFNTQSGLGFIQVDRTADTTSRVWINNTITPTGSFLSGEQITITQTSNTLYIENYQNINTIGSNSPITVIALTLFDKTSALRTVNFNGAPLTTFVTGGFINNNNVTLNVQSNTQIEDSVTVDVDNKVTSPTTAILNNILTFILNNINATDDGGTYTNRIVNITPTNVWLFKGLNDTPVLNIESKSWTVNSYRYFTRFTVNNRAAGATIITVSNVAGKKIIDVINQGDQWITLGTLEVNEISSVIQVNSSNVLDLYIEDIETVTRFAFSDGAFNSTIVDVSKFEDLIYWKLANSGSVSYGFPPFFPNFLWNPNLLFDITNTILGSNQLRTLIDNIVAVSNPSNSYDPNDFLTINVNSIQDASLLNVARELRVGTVVLDLLTSQDQLTEQKIISLNNMGNSWNINLVRTTCVQGVSFDGTGIIGVGNWLTEWLHEATVVNEDVITVSPTVSFQNELNNRIALTSGANSGYHVYLVDTEHIDYVDSTTTTTEINNDVYEPDLITLKAVPLYPSYIVSINNTAGNKLNNLQTFITTDVTWAAYWLLKQSETNVSLIQRYRLFIKEVYIGTNRKSLLSVVGYPVTGRGCGAVQDVLGLRAFLAYSTRKVLQQGYSGDFFVSNNGANVAGKLIAWKDQSGNGIDLDTGSATRFDVDSTGVSRTGALQTILRRNGIAIDLNLNKYTAVARAERLITGSNGNLFIISSNADGTGKRVFFRFSSNLIQVCLINIGGELTVVFQEVFPLGEIGVFTLSVEDNVGKFYVNKVLKATITNSGFVMPTTKAIRVGGISPETSSYNQTELVFYQDALDFAQISRVTDFLNAE